MKKNSLKRLLASLLAVVMLSQVTGAAAGVFAEGPAEQAVQTGSSVKPELRWEYFCRAYYSTLSMYYSDAWGRAA